MLLRIVVDDLPSDCRQQIESSDAPE